VYGALLNFAGDLETFAPRMQSAPYLAPPRAPILYLKPRNTWIGAADAVPLPSFASAVAVGATVGVVIRHPCTRIGAGGAARVIAGLCVINDLCLPHAEIFRPAIRERCRDGFCPMGPCIALADAGALSAEREMRTYVDGRLQAKWSTGRCVRSIARLLADVTEFMTLQAGDVLMLGTPRDMPLARAGERVAVEVDGIGRIENPVVAETAA
jgi:5-oxopent-3-ene-1,2,5-tricarboxylate decarboxylase/2-hydroxyhepta-2,4-diene-1,7-dioate isomerase